MFISKHAITGKGLSEPFLTQRNSRFLGLAPVDNLEDKVVVPDRETSSSSPTKTDTESVGKWNLRSISKVVWKGPFIEIVSHYGINSFGVTSSGGASRGPRGSIGPRGGPGTKIRPRKRSSCGCIVGNSQADLGANHRGQPLPLSCTKDVSLLLQ